MAGASTDNNRPPQVLNVIKKIFYLVTCILINLEFFLQKYFQNKDQELLELCGYDELDESDLARLTELVTDTTVNINCKDSNGLTPLLLLFWSNQSESLSECVEILLQREEINVKAKDNFGNDALTVMRRMYDGEEKDFISSLIKSKSNLTYKSKSVQPTPGEL